MEKRVVIFLLAPLLLFWHWFEPTAKKNLHGIKAYQQKKYDVALQQFLSAKGLKPDSAELKNNTASALYQLKKYKEALDEFSKIDTEKVQLSKADFYYNLGNSYFRLNQFNEALENYKKSLIKDSTDIDTKKNYELTLQKIKEQKNKDDKDKKGKNKDKQNKSQPDQNKEQKYKNMMQYLNQKEKEQMKKKKRKVGVAVKEKDW